MKRPPLVSPSGASLVETLIAAAVSSAILGCLLGGTIALQRGFEAANFHATAQNEQLRVLDYIGRDARSASNVTIQNDGARIDLAVPSGESGSLALHLELPILGSLQLGSTAAPSKSVSYYREGDRFIREMNGVQTEIARTISDFRATRTGSMLELAVTFSPKFSRSPGAATQQATQITTRVYLRNSPG